MVRLSLPNQLESAPESILSGREFLCLCHTMGLFDCTANNRKFAVGVQAIEQNRGNRLQISTANSGGSLLMVQSVSGGRKPDSKFAVQSNMPIDGSSKMKSLEEANF